MTLPIDLSRPVRTKDEQRKLVEAVRDAPPFEQETRWLEWKRTLDMTTREARTVIAKAVLGFANAFVKPVLTILTFPIILVTLGLFYFALNVAMLALAEWIAPDFSIDGFWTYVGATIVVWLVNWALYALLERMNRGRSVVV